MRSLLIVLLVAGCATAGAPAGPQEVPADANVARPAPHGPGQQMPAVTCVPDGMSAVGTWTQATFVRYARMSTLGSAGAVSIYRVQTPAGPLEVAFLVAGTVVVWIDPAPDDPMVPLWYDTGVAAPRPGVLAVVAKPAPACQWRRFHANPGGPPQEGDRET